jgi:hypothetical protein
LVGFHDVLANTRGLKRVLDRLGPEILAIIAHECLAIAWISASMIQDAVEDKVIGGVLST